MYSRPRTPSFTQPQTPAKAFKALHLDDKPLYLAPPFESDGDSDDDKITPKANTSYVPMGARPIQPSMVPDHLLLTNRMKTTTPQSKLNTSERLAPVSPSPSTEPNRPSLGNDDVSTPERKHQGPTTPLRSLSRSNSSRYSCTPSPSSSASRLDDGTLILNFDPEATTDLILIPSNQTVEFHVESAVISAASSVLADLVREILQPESDARHAAESEHKSVHIHKLDEKSEILDALLRFCYPKKRRPKVRSIAHLDRLLAACQKYQLHVGLQNLQVTMLQFASMTTSGKMLGSPLECYGMACRFGFNDIAKLASTYCLMIDIGKVDLGHALLGVDAKDTKRLFEFHNWRVCAAIKILETTVDAQELWCDGCSGLAAWYEVFLDKASYALTSAPVSTTIFSPSFTTACLKQAMKKCPDCIHHYLATKTQIRFAILQKDIDALKDTI